VEAPRRVRHGLIVRALTTDRKFFGAAALLFAGSAAVTVVWCRSMSMAGMEMPGWTMSMTWMRMPGQGWPGAAAAFIGMWTVMMIAMMLPALVPMLMRYRASITAPSPARRDALTGRVAVGYFLTWILFGALVYPGGAAIAAATMRSPLLAGAVPLIGGVTLLIAGALQLSAWKSRQLACCARPSTCRSLRVDAVGAWREGMRLGAHCLLCCAPLTAALFVLGVMDLIVMTLVTLAISAERLAPAGAHAAKIVGIVLVTLGAMTIGGHI
jgi:predicted metal-binding membrane protein